MENDSVHDVESHGNLFKGANEYVARMGHEEAEIGQTFAINSNLRDRLKSVWSGVETRGIERVGEDERNDTSITNAATIWLSANMTVSCFAVGALSGPVFGLEFVDSFLTILFINALGVLLVGFYSTFGARFGLRQMVLSRFWFGYHAVKIFATLNSISAIGWSAVNSIVGAQLLHAINNDVPGWAGIIIIAAGTGIITLFGYRVIHLYQKWSWVPGFIVFLIVLGEFAHSGQFRSLPLRSGSVKAGDVLSFAAAVFGNSTGWSTYAADYTVYMRSNTSPKKIFAWTFAGLYFPLAFTQMLGAAVVTATTHNTQYMDAYQNSGIGGLLGAVLFPPLGRFGQFCLVLLALGIIANNCPNQYSMALNLQILSKRAQRIPRFLWTTLSAVVFAAVAIAGYSSFENVLKNFMLIMGYFVAIYEGISLTEHFAFRQGCKGYNPDDWETANALPPGLAAFFASCFGVAGVMLGMAQLWYVGPIAKLIGNPSYGGDIGFELGFSFAALSYLFLRYLERNKFGR